MRRALVAAVVAVAGGAYWGTDPHAAVKPAPVTSCAFQAGQVAYVFVDLPKVGKTGILLVAGRPVRSGRVAAKDWPCTVADPRAA